MLGNLEKEKRVYHISTSWPESSHRFLTVHRSTQISVCDDLNTDTRICVITPHGEFLAGTRAV